MTERDDYQLKHWGDLVLALGGSPAPPSFTAELLGLVAKADPDNLARLRLGFPRIVRGWQWWVQLAPAITARELNTLLAGDALAQGPMFAIARAWPWPDGILRTHHPDQDDQPSPAGDAEGMDDES